MDNMLPALQSFPVALVFKILMLLVIGLFLLFILLAFVQVRALNRLVHISVGGESIIVQTVFFVYFLLVVSLFLFALVIL